jgi:hypothetical protein
MKIIKAVITTALVGGPLWLVGCASNNIQAEWMDPEFAGRSLRGEKVLIVCEANAEAVRRICQQQLTTRLTAAGVIPVASTEDNKVSPGTPESTSNLIAAARAAGAKAVWRSTVAPDATVGRQGPTIGFGVGGYGGAGGGVGAGVGVAVPVGPEQVETAYGANFVLTDVATGRVMWTSKVTTPVSRNVAGQMDNLAQSGVAAAQKAGML